MTFCHLMRGFVINLRCKRFYSITQLTTPEVEPVTRVRSGVVVSKSDDLVRNLAFEDWLFENEKFEDNQLLILWRNKPTVVCGWHQNPWVECNIPKLRKSGVDLVRRKSGGGTVYHDYGNMNCSILCHKRFYDRKKNLDMLVSALQDQWPSLDLCVNDHNDVILDKMYKVKVSGTASKLRGDKTYHHFTLLLKADAEALNDLLYHTVPGLSTKATASVRAKVAGLSDIEPDVSFDKVVPVMAAAFGDYHQQDAKVTYIYPDEASYPGLESKMADMQDWATIYGRTPTFSITRTFTCKEFGDLKIHAVFEKGCFAELILESDCKDGATNKLLNEISEDLVGKELRCKTIDECIDNFSVNYDSELHKWILIRISETFNFV